MGLKIAILFHRLGPYHVARVQSLAQVGHVTVLEMSGGKGEYEWDRIETAEGFTREVLFPNGDSRDESVSAVRRLVHESLDRISPDAVAVPGWSERAALAALEWCLLTKVPAVLMSESGFADARRTGWREAAKQMIVRGFRAAIVGGSRHKEYLVRLGLDPASLFFGYNVVDNAHFQSVGRGHGRPYFLASSRFVPKKNLPLLLRAYASYRRRSGAASWPLVLLGDGPERAGLVQLMGELGISGEVELPGFQQYSTLPAWYAGAGAFVLTSLEEQWGLVVNEAAAAGIPLLISDRCGCVPELVQTGVNGYSFSPESEADLAGLLERMTSMDEGARDVMGRASREIVRGFEPSAFGEGMRRAIATAQARPAPSFGLLDQMVIRMAMGR